MLNSSRVYGNQHICLQRGKLRLQRRQELSLHPGEHHRAAQLQLQHRQGRRRMLLRGLQVQVLKRRAQAAGKERAWALSFPAVLDLRGQKNLRFAKFALAFSRPHWYTMYRSDARHADIAQQVEHLLGKEEVTGSSPVISSSHPPRQVSCRGGFFLPARDKLNLHKGFAFSPWPSYTKKSALYKEETIFRGIPCRQLAQDAIFSPTSSRRSWPSPCR